MLPALIGQPPISVSFTTSRATCGIRAAGVLLLWTIVSSATFVLVGRLWSVYPPPSMFWQWWHYALFSDRSPVTLRLLGISAAIPSLLLIAGGIRALWHVGQTRKPSLYGETVWATDQQAEQAFDTLSGGQQARFQILLLELDGATALLLDEPTDNLDLASAEALQEGLEAFEGTVLAVTHDRWFAREFDRYLVFGSDGRVFESAQPVWEEARVDRAR